MWGFVLGLFKNPIVSLIADKTIGVINHQLELSKLERIAEINAMKDVSIAQVEESSKSLKDEWLTIFISAIITCCFIPSLQPFMIKGFEILKSAPTEILYAILIVFMGSFGVNILDKYKK
jgi:hypothetical protein